MVMIDISGLFPGQLHRNQTICKPSHLAWIQNGLGSGCRIDPAA